MALERESPEAFAQETGALERALLEALVAEHPADAAHWLEEMASADVSQILELVAAEGVARLLEHMSPLLAARALATTSTAQAARALGLLRTDVALRVLRAVAPERREDLLDELSPERREQLHRQLSYPEGTAGALMDPRVLRLRQSTTVSDALESVRSQADEVLYYLYVVDEQQRLMGVVNLRKLLQSRPGQQLGSLCRRDVYTLPARSPWEAVLAHRGWRSVHALPVVDERGRFLGAIRHEVLEQIEQGMAEEAGEASPGTLAASALGELYGLSVRGLLEWGAALVGGMNDTPRRRT